MFGAIGTTEILIIVGILILLFGAKQIPKIARSIGQSKREFGKAMKEIDDGVQPTGSGKSTVRR